MSAVHLVDPNKSCITECSPHVLYTPKSLPTMGISTLWKIQRFGMKAGVESERLKHIYWALLCLPHLGFNQPKPLLSQQDFHFQKSCVKTEGGLQADPVQ